VRTLRWPALAFALIALTSACSTSDIRVSQDILSSIPWTGPETARYRTLQDDEVNGNGELTLEERDGVLYLSQMFEFSDEEVTDAVSVEVDPRTLRPAAVQRLIVGPEGERRWDATYQGNSLTVEQSSEEDERTDVLAVPASHYEQWADLFLWRTIDFSEGFEIEYTDVLSCSLAKPDLLGVRLRVREIETVTVPAGTFQAWRLDIRSGGRNQRAWYTDDETRTLVRYDNGDLVFELESVE